MLYPILLIVLILLLIGGLPAWPYSTYARSARPPLVRSFRFDIAGKALRSVDD